MAVPLAIATAWLLLGNFCWQYFGVIQRTGGQSHPTFRTADVEPKQQSSPHSPAHERTERRLGS